LPKFINRLAQGTNGPHASDYDSIVYQLGTPVARGVSFSLIHWLI
jgi:hypothetical protein